MGWLALVPASDFYCPTIHRYLRSPCQLLVESDPLIYLGGPISIANFNEVSRVKCKPSLGKSDRLKNKMLMYKASGRVLAPDQEVLWDYNLDTRAKHDPRLHRQSSWHLVSISGMYPHCRLFTSSNFVILF